MRIAAKRGTRRVLILGYVAVAIFFAVFFLVRGLSEDGVSSGALILSAIAAAPLLLAIVWDRLASLKLFGVEIEFNKVVATTTDKAVAEAVQLQKSSNTPELVEGLVAALATPGGSTTAIHVDIRNGDYWWSTRLLLLAALVADFDAAEYLIFTGTDDRYLGGVWARAARRGLAAHDQTAAQIYRRLFAEASAHANDEQAIVSTIAFQWPYSFATDPSAGVDESAQAERRHAQLVSPEWLRSTFAGDLFDDRVVWDGSELTPAQQLGVVTQSAPLVALLCDSKFGCIFNRCRMAQQLVGAD